MTNPPPVAPVVREYIEIGAGYIVATKGDGSTYRIHAPDDAERVIVLPEFYHLFYTQMAKAIAAERATVSGELERLKEALELAIAANCKMKDALSFYADDGPTPNVDGPWKATSWDFGAFARCTLADVANIEGGKNP